jgi:hypothetical protein
MPVICESLPARQKSPGNEKERLRFALNVS